MTDLDSLIGAAAPEEQISAQFVEGVMTCVMHAQQQQQKRRLLRNGLFLSGTLIFFFLALSLLITDVIAAHTIDFVSLALMNPSMLALQEGWLALIESIPIVSLLLAIVSATLLGLLTRAFIHRVSHLPTFPLRYAH